jgi:serine/threonine protein kinase
VFSSGLTLIYCSNLSVSYVDRFKALLKKGGVVRPHDSVMEKLFKYREISLIVTETSTRAVDLYEWAKDLPGTTTRGLFRNRVGYTLNGPHGSFPNLLLAFDGKGKSYIVKRVERQSDPEVRNSLLLSGGPGLVPCSYEEMDDTTTESVHFFKGLLMPKYDRTLYDFKIDFNLDILMDHILRLVEAVNFIHECKPENIGGLVHMDIKEANIFVDAMGSWFLGDFGSCVGVGETITSTTLACYLYNVNGMKSAWKYDWFMVCLVVANQLNFNVDPINLRDRIMSYESDHQIKSLMIQLMNAHDEDLQYFNM